MMFKSAFIPFAISLVLACAQDTTFLVDVGFKTSANPFYLKGSNYAFYLNSTESPEIRLQRQRTYIFNIAINLNQTFPIYIASDPRGFGEVQAVILF